MIRYRKISRFAGTIHYSNGEKFRCRSDTRVLQRIDGTAYFSRTYPIRIVDRVGSGDSFGAGLIYSALKNMPSQERIEFTTAASCLKHSIEGDFNAVSVDEVMLLQALMFPDVCSGHPYHNRIFLL